jgi:hypothetical protein
VTITGASSLLGKVEYLRQMRVLDVTEVRYWDPGQAWARFGMGHPRGVIEGDTEVAATGDGKLCHSERTRGMTTRLSYDLTSPSGLTDARSIAIDSVVVRSRRKPGSNGRMRPVATCPSGNQPGAKDLDRCRRSSTDDGTARHQGTAARTERKRAGP